MKNHSLTLLALSLSTLTACADDSSSYGQAGLAMQAASTPSEATTVTASPNLILVDAADTTYDVHAASLHLRDIELSLPDGVTCEDISDEELVGAVCESGEDKIEIEGPIVVDLVTGQTEPSLAEVTIPAGTYDRIDFRVEDGDPEDGVVAEDSPLDDRSFVVSATFDHHGQATELALSLRFNEDIRIEQPGGVEVAPGQDLIATWVTQSWLGGVDVGACLDEGDLPLEGNVAMVDDDTTEGTCSDIENVIKDNMKKSGQLGGA